MRSVPSNDPDDDFMVEITSLDTPKTSEHVHDGVLQGARLAPRVRTWLTILSVMGGLLLIFVVLFPVLSSLLPKKTSTPHVFHPPVQIKNVTVQKGIAYISSSDGIWRAFRVKDGSLLWQRTLPDVRPFFVNNTMYICYYDQQFYTVRALRASDAAPLWTFRISSTPSIIPLAIDNGVVHSLYDPLQVSINNPIQNGMIIALDGRTGTERWRYNIHASTSLNISVQTMQDKVYITRCSDYQMRNVTLLALKSSDGLPLWNYTNRDLRQTNPSTDTPPTLILPLTPNGPVYLTMSDGSLKALDTHNGREIWQYTPAHNTYASSSQGQKTFYIQTLNNPLKALRADNGTLAWSYNDPWGIRTVFSEVEGVLYLETGNGFIVALRANDGKRLWHVQPIDPPFTVDSLFIEGNIAYTFTQIGNAAELRIVALRISDGMRLWQRKMSMSNGMFFPQVSDNQLFIYFGSTITALRAYDGFVLWHVNYTLQFALPLTISGNVTLLRLSNSILEAHQADTGVVLWRYPHS